MSIFPICPRNNKVAPTTVSNLSGAQTSATPPGPGLLKRLSTTKLGLIIGSSPTRTVGGALIGVGVACILSGFGAAVGVPLILGGVALWGGSTLLSTAALEKKDASSIALHLARSAFTGAGGVLVGAFLGPGCLAAGALGFFVLSIAATLPTLVANTLIDGAVNLWNENRVNEQEQQPQLVAQNNFISDGHLVGQN